MNNLKKLGEDGFREAYADRKKHFYNVAKGMGFNNDKEAFTALGRKFTDKAEVDAPKINNRLKRKRNG